MIIIDTLTIRMRYMTRNNNIKFKIQDKDT